MENWNLRVPTSVAAFDSIVKGGIPLGSVVLLVGEPGAGNVEFAYTSVSRLNIARLNPERRKMILGHYSEENTYLPEKTCYPTFCRSEEEILMDVRLSFNEDIYNAFKENLEFKDLSKLYFAKSIVPKNWFEEDYKSFLKSEKKDVLSEFVKYLDNNLEESVVIVDSLTDLITSPYVDNNDLVEVIKGLQRFSKKKNTIIYILMTENIGEKQVEQMLYDAVDGVLVFEWSRNIKKSSHIHRYMYVLKFTGLMSHLDKEHIARFDTILNPMDGFVVTSMQKIR